MNSVPIINLVIQVSKQDISLKKKKMSQWPHYNRDDYEFGDQTHSRQHIKSPLWCANIFLHLLMVFHFAKQMA